VPKNVGIDIDVAENGVFLSEAAHPGGHAYAYFDAVNDALRKFAKSGPEAQQAVIDTLKVLRNDLLNGTLKVGR
jgi:A nuclease family of the HNH/ENDO VII superfamily with conserved AHH